MNIHAPIFGPPFNIQCPLTPQTSVKAGNTQRATVFPSPSLAESNVTGTPHPDRTPTEKECGVPAAPMT